MASKVTLSLDPLGPDVVLVSASPVSDENAQSSLTSRHVTRIRPV